MAPKTLRFVTANVCELIVAPGGGYTPVIMNGTGGGAPAREEDLGYPLENLLFKDRYTMWATTTVPPATVYIDIALPSLQTVSVCAFLGIRRTPHYTLPASFQLFVSSQGSIYPPTSFGVATFNLVQTINIQGRDGGFLFTPTQSRYWRFAINLAVLPFALGHVLLGNVDIDTGLLMSPGSLYAAGASYKMSRNRTRNRTIMGSPVITQRGDDGGSRVIPFRNVRTSVKDAMLQLASFNRPTLMIDPFDNFSEVELLNDEIDPRHTWAFPDSWDFDVALEVLP